MFQLEFQQPAKRWRDPRRHEATLRIAIGHLARHHSRDTDAAHTHHRPNGERLSRRQAVAVLRLAVYRTRNSYRSQHDCPADRNCTNESSSSASSRLPESSKERSAAQRLSIRAAQIIERRSRDQCDSVLDGPPSSPLLDPRHYPNNHLLTIIRRFSRFRPDLSQQSGSDSGHS